MSRVLPVHRWRCLQVQTAHRPGDQSPQSRYDPPAQSQIYQPPNPRRSYQTYTSEHNTITYTHLAALFSQVSRWDGTRQEKPIWILLKQETVSGSGISWATCKSASRSRQITMPVTRHSVFMGRMPFLPPNQQRQSIEGNTINSDSN